MWQFVFETGLGWIALTLEDRAVARLTLGGTNRDSLLARLDQFFTGERAIERLPRATECKYRFAQECRSRILEYERSGGNLLQAIPYVDPSRTRFQGAVVRACRSIPAGEVLTYAQIAELAGSPGACRAVGNQMARNPLPLIIPCHRVVGSNGGLGGYSAPSGLNLKRFLLDLEAKNLPATSS